MRITALTGNVVTVAATRQELGVLVAAARMALDAVRADPAAPEEAARRLASVLRDYDTAIAPIRAATGGRHTVRR